MLDRMTHPRRGAVKGSLALVALLAVACSTTGEAPPGASAAASETMLDRATRADSLRTSHTDADVAFMRGMIHHHAQALVMSEMAPTHGAGDRLRTLTARIITSQRDEIALMTDWLEDRGLEAPHVEPDGTMPHAHAMEPMPGMLTDEEMADLDAARGIEFEQKFLTYMILHHQGALTMVEELLATPGAAQNETTFRLASDIGADQTSEIERMRTMLHAIIVATPGSP